MHEIELRADVDFSRTSNVVHVRAIFVWSWKMVSVSVFYLFYQPIDGKNKAWTLRFPAKENPNMEKALFDWPIVLQYDVKAISRKFFGHEVCLPERSLSQPKARCVCIRSIHQSNRSISVRLLFLFCSRVKVIRKSLYSCTLHVTHWKHDQMGGGDGCDFTGT